MQGTSPARCSAMHPHNHQKGIAIYSSFSLHVSTERVKDQCLFSKHPTRSASGCPGAWGCHQLLMRPPSSLMQMAFLRSSFWHVSEALVYHPPCSKTRQSFEALPSSAGFIENLLKPSLAPGFVVHSLLRRKSAVGGSLGLMTAQSFLSLYGSSHSLPSSQNCSATFL